MSISTAHASTTSKDRFHLPAFFAAACAALAGAVIWAVVVRLTGYEVGYLAWGIGGLVGLAAVKFGGRGMAMAGSAATLTICAIFVGKFMGTQLIIENELETVRQEEFSVALFEELKGDAEVWSSLQPGPDESEVRQFMLERAFGGFDGSGEVSSEELAYFHASSVPLMERLRADQPKFADWQEQAFGDYRAEVTAELSFVSLVFDDLNPIDLIFAFLAVSTAFGMIKRASLADDGSDEGGAQPPATGE